MPLALGFRNLLVPVSNNEESERAMDVACRLAADRGASIAAVTVIEVPPDLPLDSYMTDEEAAAHLLLERAAAIADSYGVTVMPKILRARGAADAIVAQTVERRTEIVVIGAPRHRNKPFGSTVEHVLKKARCRVMVIGAAPSAATVATDVAA